MSFIELKKVFLAVCQLRSLSTAYGGVNDFIKELVALNFQLPLI